ncbi:MAG TPA: TIGR04255 family protein [Ignavibacteria bacterium]
MSKLPKAPLVEIVLELRWKIINKSDLSKVQYLYGDLYSELKQKYPHRESTVPTEIPIDILINQPVHRYRSAPNDYPLVQVGPGIITLNTVDSKYYWDTFSEWAEELIISFLKVYPIDINDKLTPSVLFIDFFPFDFEKDDIHKFLNDKFNITFGQSFFDSPKYPTNLNLGFFYSLPIGDLSINFQKGKSINKQDGIILQTRINGNSLNANKEEISDWINKSHEICSDLFKKLTEGELYESFKN